MVRETSANAYHDIKERGLLSAMRLMVYEALLFYGPMTASELDKKSGKKGTWKRLSELRDRGLVREVGTRPCSVTGHIVVEWEVIRDVLPIEPEKKKRLKDASKPDVIELVHYVRKHYNADLSADPIPGVERAIQWLMKKYEITP